MGNLIAENSDGFLKTDIVDPKILIGADPELFVFDKDKKEFISAHDIFPGTKMIPFEVQDGMIQVDGTAFEFNVKPSSTPGQFLESISNVLSISSSIMRKRSTALEFRAVPHVLYSKAYFDSLPEESKELGCDPDFNAYTGEPNPKPSTDLPLRTGSGHIHTGWRADGDKWEDDHFYNCRLMSIQLDCALFIPSLLWDNDDRRRDLYGNPGAFRPKSYGCEYRVLSNKWISDPKLIKYVFSATKRASEILFENCRLAADKDIRDFLKDILSSPLKPKKTELIDYVTMLENDFDFPVFPLEYL